MLVDAKQPLSIPIRGAGGLTGTWRSQRPVLDKETCKNCQLCWLFCPEAVISRNDLTIDLDYCKGCGVCAKECPVKAITMVKEGQA